MSALGNASYATTTAAGTFNITSTGYVQGMVMDEPAVRFQLAGGIVSTAETLPMYGGIAISESTTPNTGTNAPDSTQGGIISRATNVTAASANNYTGFTVFTQAYGMVITPQQNVPNAGSGQQVMFFRKNSLARVKVQCAPTILAAVEGNVINQQVSWDWYNQLLIPFVSAWASASVSSATYTSTTGILALTFGAAPFGASVGATLDGYFISISGLAGTGNVASLNGNFAITSTGTSGTVINVQAPIGLGTITITGSTGALAAGGGALPVSVLNVEQGNSMVVASPTNQSWNYTGNCALIQI